MSEEKDPVAVTLALDMFVQDAQAMIDERWTGKPEWKPVLSIDPNGKKYARIVRNEPSGKSVYCFVNRENGDILKSASWKAPAQHARGNIFDADPSQAITEYGAKSLR